MKRVPLHEQIAKTPRAWIPYPVAEVDDQIVYLALYKDGSHPLYDSGNKFHRHEGDQLLLVLRGTVVLEEPEGAQTVLREGDSILVPRGRQHRASSKEGAHVLHVQSKAVYRSMKEEFDRGPEIVAG